MLREVRQVPAERVRQEVRRIAGNGPVHHRRRKVAPFDSRKRLPFAVEILDAYHALEYPKPQMLNLGIKEGAKEWK